MRETCDRCSAAAIYAFRQDHRESSLMLCWHHTAAHVDALTEHGWRMLALPARATLEREALAGGRALQL